MKKTILLLLIIGNFLNSFAQNTLSNTPFEIYKSDVMKEKIKKLTFYTLDDQDNGVIISKFHSEGVKSGEIGLTINHYNSDLSIMTTHNKILKNGKVIYAFRKDSMIGFFHKKNTKNKTYDLFLSTAIIGEFNFSTKKVLTLDSKSLDKPKFFTALQNADKNIYGNIVFSKNKTFFGFSIDLKNNGKEYHKYYVFDVSLNKIYEQDFTKDIKDTQYFYRDLILDEETTNFYMLGEDKSDKNKYHYEINKITKANVTTTKVESGDHKISYLFLRIHDDNLYCLGFYSDIIEKKYKGTAFIKYNKELNIKASKYSPFSKQLYIDKFGKEKDNELTSIYLRSFHFKKDGGVLLTAEEYTHFSSRGVNNIKMNTHTFKDIMTMNLDSEGNLLWSRNINKKQKATYNSSYYSFKSTYHNEKLYYILNSSKEISNDKIQFGGNGTKNQSLFTIVFDEDGNYEYAKLIDDKIIKTPYRVRSGKIFNDYIILNGWDKPKNQILKLKFL